MSTIWLMARRELGQRLGLTAAWLIARRELGRYFGTALGWLILAGYLLSTGLLFNAFAVGAQPKLSQRVLEDYIYLSSGMVLVAAVLLAMRLIAEERQMRTLILLRTAPVTERQIVWGKFLAALVFVAAMVAASAYIPALIFVHGRVSVAHIAVGYLGLILLGAASIAIGLLASAWSRSQLMAGMVGALMVALLTIAWMVGRITEEPLKTLFGTLALHNLHFQNFQRGVLNLRDVGYYLGVTLFFLEASVAALESWRWRQ
ncbi:MAG: ABC transporter permease subunit [Candidatus Lambdaproteobacteria bacterium]|nr:ABC transporter permease subunit [Candidatus Lambdaproteobacteria bacterium]